jgi:hypothetical protein
MNKMKKSKKKNHRKINKGKRKRRKIKLTSLNSRNSLLLEDSQTKIGGWVSTKNSAPVSVFLKMENQFLQEEVMTLCSALENKANNGNNSTD